MSRRHTSPSRSSSGFKPALTVLLRAQEEASLAARRSPQRDPQRRSAKGLLKSMSAQRLEPLAVAGRPGSQIGSPVLGSPQLQQQFQSRQQSPVEQQQAPQADVWQPTSSPGSSGSLTPQRTPQRSQSVAQLAPLQRSPALSQHLPQEEKEPTPSSSPASQSPPPGLASPLNLSPSQQVRQNASYARKTRPPDSSRKHSTYASSFRPLPVARVTKQGQDYFASHNKSYIGSCLQDPGYGFDLAKLPKQDPSAHFAAEVKREHESPSDSARERQKMRHNTTNRADFAPPSPELLRARVRAGADYRQAGNRSYIRLNLVDAEHAPHLQVLGGPGCALPPGSPLPPGNVVPVPSNSVRVPFLARSTHKETYLDFSPHYPSLRAASKATVVFGSESAPEENIWARPWDDNYDD